MSPSAAPSQPTAAGRPVRARAAALLQTLSLALHLGGGVALLRLEPPAPAPRPTVVQLKAAPKPKPPPPPEEPPPPPPPEPAPAPAPAPKPAPAPAPAPAGPPPPDFGVMLAGVGPGGGPGGVAVPAGSPGGERRTSSRELGEPPPAPADGGCAEPEVRPKATHMPHPTYTEEARAAGVEGKVRIELTVDASGAVTTAKVLSPLGHGLDENALTTVKQARFSPATRCGKPVPSTFTLSVRFTL